MAVVIVAGGLGDLGRPIMDALFESGQYEAYAMSRKSPADGWNTERTSPLTGKRYFPIIQTDYMSEDALAEQLAAKQAAVVICALPMESDATCETQLRLIRAADKCSNVKRFVPSEFNVEYDVGDDILPYPEKRFHLAARRELAKTTSLEYSYIYPGMFMDYFGLPRVASSLRPLCFCVDAENGQAILPGDGEGRMSMTCTVDAARYLVMALQLEKWPRIMKVVASTVSMNELVKIFEKTLGRKLEVRYQPVEKLLKHEAIDLPVNIAIAERFSDRFPQGIKGIVADLEASVALGGYDLDRLGEHLDLVKRFEGRTPPPKSIEQLIEEAWKPS
ncbi:uncharacterized protein E0L32_010787 [Thyridium curvatum]|uniref:NmrA-like domain-containing protein n=1 Tax=Thyridium curvatum TaxID=1093900 RepID=A0A507ASU6_9PEZI|nr:uncharacterized protein E0L32_010787 [Thyridium curvatum]TPX07290.1 hypothetical protein E0L32_010787 [Thyridium curvatum]